VLLGVGEDGIIRVEAILIEQCLVAVELSAGFFAVMRMKYKLKTYPTPWMSSSGFSKHRSSYLPAIVSVEAELRYVRA